MWKKLAVGALAGTGLTLAGAWGYGRSLPPTYEATLSAELSASPEITWAALTDYASFPAWRGDVDGVTSEAFGWIEHTPKGDRPIKITAMEPPRSLGTRLDPDAGLGYAFTRTYTLEPAASGTRLTLTESGTIEAPLARLRAQLNGPQTPAEVLLAELRTNLKERP